MRLFRIFFFSVIISTRAAFAWDLTTSDGEVLTDCKIVAVEQDALIVEGTNSGNRSGNRIEYERLPPQLQKRYFDPDKVAAYRKLQAEQNAKAEKANTTAERIVIFVIVPVACVVFLLIYFLPSIIGRRKANATAIFVMNLFLGWIFIGWVIALIWACTKDQNKNA